MGKNPLQGRNGSRKNTLEMLGVDLQQSVLREASKDHSGQEGRMEGNGLSVTERDPREMHRTVRDGLVPGGQSHTNFSCAQSPLVRDQSQGENAVVTREAGGVHESSQRPASTQDAQTKPQGGRHWADCFSIHVIL